MGSAAKVIAEPATTARALERARMAFKERATRVRVIERGATRLLRVVRRGAGPLTTPVGDFWQFHFRVDDAWRDYHVLAAGELDRNLLPILSGDGPLLVRLDSGCLTGQLFLDQTCDCRQQLQVAMARIHAAGRGLIISMPTQDGRGMGLDFKLATLLLQQEANLDTYQAAARLSNSECVDARSYCGAIGILKYLGVPVNQWIRLMTNNPEKLGAFKDNSYTRVERYPIRIQPTRHTARHLAAKIQKLGHLK